FWLHLWSYCLVWAGPALPGVGRDRNPSSGMPHEPQSLARRQLRFFPYSDANSSKARESGLKCASEDAHWKLNHDAEKREPELLMNQLKCQTRRTVTTKIADDAFKYALQNVFASYLSVYTDCYSDARGPNALQALLEGSTLQQILLQSLKLLSKVALFDGSRENLIVQPIQARTTTKARLTFSLGEAPTSASPML
ncbi:hypothetical protein STEG23_006079, partial [Scotinomys teguina]